MAVEATNLPPAAPAPSPPPNAPTPPRVTPVADSARHAPSDYSSDSFFKQLKDLQDNKKGDLLYQAEDLISSTQTMLRALGYALLELEGKLNTNTIRLLAHETDLTTPLMVLDWLNDSDKPYQAQELEWALQERIENMDTVLDIIDSGILQAGGGRSMMAMLKGILPAEDLTLLYSDLTLRPGQDDFTRLRALMEWSDLSDSDDYRMQAMMATSNTPVLHADMEAWMRFTAGDSGPMTPEDVDHLTDDNAPQRAVLLATTLEFLYDHSSARLGSGVYPRVQAYLSAVTNRNLTASEEKAVARIRNLLDEIKMMDPSQTETNWTPSLRP